jgi:acetyl-CoA C-acetyltransferase
VGQAPARQAVLAAGLPTSLPCTTINKVCGSGMKAVMLAHDQILAGVADIVVAGGMESMTNAPYLLPKARGGYRLGHGQLLDHMFYDGLQNPYDNQLMGAFAEQCADKYGFTRDQQDAFAAESVRRALAAMKEGAFASEIAAIMLAGKKGELRVDSVGFRQPATSRRFDAQSPFERKAEHHASSSSSPTAPRHWC